MRALAGLVLISMGLSGCFNMPVLSKGKVSTIDEAPRLAVSVSSGETKAISSYDSNSKVATTIPAPSGALAGSSVTFPAGALSISADLVVEEAVPLAQTSVATSLAISSDISIKPVGSGLIIRPTTDVDLTKPLTISMPISPSAGLHNWISTSLALNASTYYTVFYKYFINGELKAGVIPTSTLRYAANGAVLFEGYFGAYWLAEVSAPIEQKIEVKTEEPIINKDKVSVVTSTGVVTESVILTKAAIPQVEWTTVSLVLDSSKRIVAAKAAISAGRTLSNCVVDFFEKAESGSGINVESGANLFVSYSIVKQEAHNLQARFRCIDDQGRLAVSPWSASVAIPAVEKTPVATGGDYCSTTQPDVRLLIGPPASAGSVPISSLSAYKSFTAVGSCQYKMELDTAGDFAFGIQTADGQTCSLAAVTQGSQILSCSNTGTATAMFLPQSNYTITLDFSSNAKTPKMIVALQACSLGDMYLLRASSAGSLPSPDATNRMTHLGGCQFSAQTAAGSYGTNYVRIQNESGTYRCGDEGSIAPGSMRTISCGTTGTQFTQQVYGGAVTGHRYLVNLGSNLDVTGQPTSTPYIWYIEVDNCMSNYYVLGPTAAGNSRILGVNNLVKGYGCSFRFSTVPEAPFTPFYIGVGDGTQKCGMFAGQAQSASMSLDCSSAAVPIDMQAQLAVNEPYNFNVSMDAAGVPNYINVNMLYPSCPDPLYAVKNGTNGFIPTLSRLLTEVRECVYEYEWTPTATDRTFMFMRGNTSNYRCGKFPGSYNPTVNGPATNVSCMTEYQMTTDFPVTPIGIVDGTTYKLTFDLRMDSMGPGKLKIAPKTALSCPTSMHVLGLPGLSYTPDSSNIMTRVGDCNYVMNYRVAQSGYLNWSFANDANTMNCARDGSLPYQNQNPDFSRTVGVLCSSAAPTLFSVNTSVGSDVQFQLHYDGANSTTSISQYYQNCGYSVFDGPAALDQTAGYVKSSTYVDSCVEDFLWVPQSNVSSFRFKNSMYATSSYCALLPGGSAITVNGADQNSICNGYNPNAMIDFSVAGGVNPGSKYLVRLDRRGTPLLPAKVSVSAVADYFTGTLGTWKDGVPAGYDIYNQQTYPGSRDSAATWTDGSGTMYMFGGYGPDENGSMNYLADFWRYNGSSWVLWPQSNDYGVANGLNYAIGIYHASNRPSARIGAATVLDSNGRLWLFGGFGRDSVGNLGFLNDLWAFDTSTNQWALMSGTLFVNSYGVGGSGSAAHGNYPGGRNNSRAWMGPGGKIFIFGGRGFCDTLCSNTSTAGLLNDTWAFDPTGSAATSTWQFISGDHALDSSGYSGLPAARELAFSWQDVNGYTWLFGGYGVSANTVNGPPYGAKNDLWIVAPGANTWQKVGGPDFNESLGTPSIKGVASNKVWPPARYGGNSWFQGSQKLWLFGGYGQAGGYYGSGTFNDVWRYDIGGNWAFVSGSGTGPQSTPNQASSFGSLGQTNASFYPASRQAAMLWPYGSNKVMIFGGLGSFNTNQLGRMNDFWQLEF